ncbi:MAG TPA: cytochrome b/b6 domain-containing protein [Anaerolineales bacterium]|nr:cytochrome b/b6 domain-containing protein [Anaerolineales bacterium]
MGHTNISLQERRRLRAKTYKKHNLANILTHWFNVAMWLLLLPTGIAIISSPRLGLSPVWLQELFRNIFGGTANLIRFHYTVGLLWVVVITFNILLGFRRYFVPFAAHRMLLDKDDINWLKVKPLQMLGFYKGQPLPPQDAYNAGQKLYMYVVILGTIGIMTSGIIMTFNTVFPAWLKQIAQPIHWVSVFSVVAGLIIHVYMGAVFPEEKEAFFSMFSGKVSAWYARAHHEKWYWEKVEEELAWEDRVQRELASEAAHAEAVQPGTVPSGAAD